MTTPLPAAAAHAPAGPAMTLTAQPSLPQGENQLYLRVDGALIKVKLVGRAEVTAARKKVAELFGEYLRTIGGTPEMINYTRLSVSYTDRNGCVVYQSLDREVVATHSELKDLAEAVRKAAQLLLPSGNRESHFVTPGQAWPLRIPKSLDKYLCVGWVKALEAGATSRFPGLMNFVGLSCGDLGFAKLYDAYSRGRLAPPEEGLNRILATERLMQALQKEIKELARNVESQLADAALLEDARQALRTEAKVYQKLLDLLRSVKRDALFAAVFIGSGIPLAQLEDPVERAAKAGRTTYILQGILEKQLRSQCKSHEICLGDVKRYAQEAGDTLIHDPSARLQRFEGDDQQSRGTQSCFIEEFLVHNILHLQEFSSPLESETFRKEAIQSLHINMSPGLLFYLSSALGCARKAARETYDIASKTEPTKPWADRVKAMQRETHLAPLFQPGRDS